MIVKFRAICWPWLNSGLRVLDLSAPPPAVCAIALGSNLGDSLSTLQRALRDLAATPGIALQACSPWYRTAPIGPPQPDYLNGCALLQSQLPPLALLDCLLALEQRCGRVRRERWGPRTLDLDLLLWGDRVIELPRLQVPHPRMRDRPFVLVPLADIAPDWRDPQTGQTIGQLLHGLDCSGVSPLATEVCP